MNQGPLIFLGVFFALAMSWFGLVLTPQMSIGRQEQVKLVDSGALYPSVPPGLAKQGAEVYRANGCNYCHSQQIGITGVDFKLVLADLGTNSADVALAVAKIVPDLGDTGFAQLAQSLPQTLLTTADAKDADSAVQRLTAAGAKARREIVLLGPDIERGWGSRRTVANDYLYDGPVMLGSTRIGPDLANVGQRLRDPRWHLRHLYEPKSVVTNSIMPPYRFLFEKRRIKDRPSPDALALDGPYAPEPGYEIVPKPEATLLVEYLLSRRVEHVLFEAPAPFVEPLTNVVSSATNTAVAAANPPAPR